METILGDNIDFTKYAAEFDTAAASINQVPIPGFSVAAELEVVKAIAGPAGRLANQAQAAWDLKRISEIARKIDGPLKKVVDDIQTGLVSSQEALNAAVKFWETCENERLEVIYAHPNVNPVEISTLFENYQTKLASLKAQNRVVLNTKDSLDAVLVANKKLSDPKLKIEDAKIWIEAGAKSMKEFKTIVDELDKL
jgi:hypothetical protein